MGLQSHKQLLQLSTYLVVRCRSLVSLPKPPILGKTISYRGDGSGGMTELDLRWMLNPDLRLLLLLFLLLQPNQVQRAVSR